MLKKPSFKPLAQRFIACTATVSVALLAAILPLAAGAQTANMSTPALQSEVIAGDLQNPWGLAFLPGGRFLVTERGGSLRIIEADGRLRAPITKLPAIAVGGQGGLLDVLVDSDFANNRSL